MSAAVHCSRLPTARSIPLIRAQLPDDACYSWHMAASEHILLESDERRIPHPRSSRKLHARIELQSRMRRRGLQLELVDYYYLVVRSVRSRSVAAEYVLDLRFANAVPESSRHFASRWLVAALVLAALAAAIAFRTTGSEAAAGWLAACAIVTGMAVAAAVTCIYRTTETISMYSAHGRAKVFEFTSGLGATRAFRPFMSKLAAHIQLAVAARRPMRAEHLRDEMREHFRLRELGVLSVEDYEASKVRILAEHSSTGSPDGLTARERRAARLAPDMEGGWY
jgi:hypothetical protein